MNNNTEAFYLVSDVSFYLWQVVALVGEAIKQYVTGHVLELVLMLT